jgi:DNA-binding response OmpR family regulator
MSGELHIVGLQSFMQTLWISPYQTKPPTQLRVWSLLSSEPGRIFSLYELLDYAYGDQEDGGPDGAAYQINLAIFKLRQKGCAIRCHRSRGWSAVKREEVAA